MKKIALFCCAGLLIFVANIAYAADIKGGKDHPSIGRFQGSDIEQKVSKLSLSADLNLCHFI